MTDQADIEEDIQGGVAQSQGSEVFGKVMRNGATIAISRLLAAVTAIAIVPVIVHELGLAGYGVWETLFAVTSLITMILGALGTTFLWKISQIDASGDVTEAARLVGVAVFLVFAIAMAVGKAGETWVAAPFWVSQKFRQYRPEFFFVAHDINPAVGGFIQLAWCQHRVRRAWQPVLDHICI